VAAGGYVSFSIFKTMDLRVRQQIGWVIANSVIHFVLMS